MRGQQYLLAGSAIVAALWPDALAAAETPAGFATSVHITSIVMNGLVRIAAIAAGVYVVLLGHNTLVRGIKGDFEFEGKFGKLKGSAPGLLFVFLGTLAIGWALQTTASGELEMRTSESTKSETSRPDPVTNGRPSDQPPPFMSGTNGGSQQ